MAKRAVSHTGLPIVADTAALADLAAGLRSAAPAVWAATRTSLRAAANPVAADARSRASFSDRIPGSVKVLVSSRAVVKIRAGGVPAPDGAPLEHRGMGGQFRHPVFGNPQIDWVPQPARPFLGPALDAHRDQVADEVMKAAADAVARYVGGR